VTIFILFSPSCPTNIPEAGICKVPRHVAAGIYRALAGAMTPRNHGNPATIAEGAVMVKPALRLPHKLHVQTNLILECFH
jgi:hypothetical protein